MSEATTAASTATTEVQASTAAPEVQAQNVEQTNQVEVTENTNTEAEVQTEAKAEEPDYSYVPKKFLKDGKPDWESLTKSYQHMEKKASQKGVLVPEDVSEYQWAGNSPVPINDEQAAAFKAEAQKAGFTKEQYAFVMDKYSELMTNTGFSADASAHALQKVWGEDFQANVNLARRAFDEFAPSDMSMDDPVFNHPTVVRLLARMGQELREDSQSQSARASTPSGMTKDDIHEIMRSKDYKSSIEKQRLVQQWYESKYK